MRERIRDPSSISRSIINEDARTVIALPYPRLRNTKQRFDLSRDKQCDSTLRLFGFPARGTRQLCVASKATVIVTYLRDITWERFHYYSWQPKTGESSIFNRHATHVLSKGGGENAYAKLALASGQVQELKVHLTACAREIMRTLRIGVTWRS